MVACMHACMGVQAAAAEKDPSKFSGKKSKAAAKKGAGATQYEILSKSGIPAEEIPEFRWVRARVWGGRGGGVLPATVDAPHSPVAVPAAA